MVSLDLASVLEALPAPAFVVDEMGRVTMWNAAMVELTGRSAAEVKGQKAWKGFSPKRIPLPVDDAVGDGAPASGPLTFDGPRGKVVVELDARPILDGSVVKGAAVSVRTPTADRTDAVVRAALDGAGQAVMMIDRDFRITYANRATYECSAPTRTSSARCSRASARRT
ncbi:MAG: PAS domain-containing protein [Myxococcota bacterium]